MSTTTTETPGLPPCCVPREDADLTERLYCTYNSGGPAERAGLAWDGRPCPTFSDLEGAAAEGRPGPAAVVDKWEAVSLAVLGAAEQLALLCLAQALTARVPASVVNTGERAFSELAEETLYATYPRLAGLVWIEPASNPITRYGRFSVRGRVGATVLPLALYVIAPDEVA